MDIAKVAYGTLLQYVVIRIYIYRERERERERECMALPKEAIFLVHMIIQ